ncbi:H-type small acid-soluble spore protein [Virgibacillus sp. LDC-1]|uniref:H-type small acid-soluble spore protein n=1 Tax=Virgibacillus sp. LDC-1 TaxID=3039856 RepID=UPI0024DEBC2A|nr:H-type small acid-soluble spore protein [Virgibacillus sp. LDC-1]
MDAKRAQEIIATPTLINVSYYGIPVFLKEVQQDQSTVMVFPLDEMDSEQIVDLNGLDEQGP